MTYQAPIYARGVTYYLPADWMDEVLPDLAASPVDLVERDDSGQWWLRLPVGNPDRNEEHYQTKIEPDHAYSWNERRMHGAYEIEVREDGSWSGNGIPAECNCFCDEDHWGEDVFDSIDDFIKRGNVDEPSKPMPAGTYWVAAWHWSDDISLLFEVVEGIPSFREVGHA